MSRHALSQIRPLRREFGLASAAPTNAPPLTKRRRERPPKPPPPPQLPLKEMTPELWAQVEPTTLTVFHNPADKTSTEAKESILEATENYPRLSAKYSKKKTPQPLKLEVVVHERAPTADEFRLICVLLPEPSFTMFVPPQLRPELRNSPTSAKALAELVTTQPELLWWPVVVDWAHDEVSIGGGYSTMLERARARRREVLEPEKPPERYPYVPPSTEWIDYD
ncbi:hypothetical protein C8R46DRAFT_1206422 [Mycena filopes]|nr:hypothetical protein C8R46DRAFT_1206422 [Mycena filopes]